MNSKCALLILTLIFMGTAQSNDVIRYKVQMRWVPEQNALSISQNAIGLPPTCENCITPIEWIQCGYNTQSGTLANGQDACIVDDKDAGFGIKVKFNNASQCVGTSNPYKYEWASFANNLPNNVSGVKTAHMNPITGLTTLTIECQIQTRALKLLKKNSVPLNPLIKSNLISAIKFDRSFAYDLQNAHPKQKAIKSTLDLTTPKHVEYMIQQYDGDIHILPTVDRVPVEIVEPKNYVSSRVNPRYDIWMFISEQPVDKSAVGINIEPIINGKCDSLASNTKSNSVSIYLSSSGEKGTCALDNGTDYWLVWYILDKGY